MWAELDCIAMGDVDESVAMVADECVTTGDWVVLL